MKLPASPIPFLHTHINSQVEPSENHVLNFLGDVLDNSEFGGEDLVSGNISGCIRCGRRLRDIYNFINNHRRPDRRVDLLSVAV